MNFQDKITRGLIDLYRVVVRRHQDTPFTMIAVVDPPTEPGTPASGSGGRLRFILACAAPELRPYYCSGVEALNNLPDVQRLVLLNGDVNLPYSLRAQLKLEAIHPGHHGILDALATMRPEAEDGG